MNVGGTGLDYKDYREREEDKTEEWRRNMIKI